MGYIKYFLFFSFFPCYVTSQTWQQLSDFPATERDDGIVFVVGNKAYCGTGLKAGWIATNDFYSFDLTSEIWDTIAVMNGPARQYACAFSNDSNGFVFGGLTSNVVLNDVWKYDIVNNSWQSKSSKPGSGLYGSSCFSIGDKAYVINGTDSTDQIVNEVWEYDMINDIWMQKNNLPGDGRFRASACAVNGKGYLIHGRDSLNNYHKELLEYDPGNDSWTIVDSFPLQGRDYASMVSVYDKLIVFGGSDSLFNFYNDVWMYDLQDQNWIQLPSLPSLERRGGMCFLDNNEWYYTTGLQPQARLKETWKLSGIVGVEKANKTNSIEVYPNPFVNTVFFKNTIGIKEVYVSDIAGREIYRGEVSSTQNKINLKNITPGIYLLTLVSRDQTVTIRKLIKE